MCAFRGTRKECEVSMERKNGLLAPVKLKILFTIVDRKKCSFYLDILEGFEVNYQLVLYGRGTASSDLLQLLGLSNDDKAVIMSFVKENYINTILNLYEDKYFKLKNGKGIAFTVPLSSMVGKMAFSYLTNMGGK